MSEREMCACGRPKSRPDDFRRWVAELPNDARYQYAPSTWQHVRDGGGLSTDAEHASAVYPAWALRLCWTLYEVCRLPSVDP